MDLIPALLLTLTPQPAGKAPTDPADVEEVDAIDCRLDQASYMQFAMAVAGEEQLARKRHWKKVAPKTSFIDEYQLPKPIVVAGSYSTRHIGFTGNGILAILDVPDPAIIARAEHVDNVVTAQPLIDAIVATGKRTRSQVEADMPFRKFLGERIIQDKTEPARDGEDFGSHVVVARTISNATTHPGKTFYGCSYRFEMLDKDGKSL